MLKSEYSCNRRTGEWFGSQRKAVNNKSVRIVEREDIALVDILGIQSYPGGSVRLSSEMYGMDGALVETENGTAQGV